MTIRKNPLIFVLLQLSFKSRQLRQLCESSSRARRSLGLGVANKLQVVLEDLTVVDNVGDLGLPSESFNYDSNTVKIRLVADLHLYFLPNHNVLPLRASK
jgi:hypothetical protein